MPDHLGTDPEHLSFGLKPMSTYRLRALQRPKIHIDLAFYKYFQDYDESFDGGAIVATYSFSDTLISIWGGLSPESRFLVGHKGKGATSAANLAKRYPWFEIRLIPELHSKVIYFKGSRRLLIGSLNFFSNSPNYSEAAIEILISSVESQKVQNLLFGHLSGNQLPCKYSCQDVRFWKGGPIEGRPCLPCHLEVAHWETRRMEATFTDMGLSKVLADSVVGGAHFLYGVAEYHLNGDEHFTAFNRGYQYCGDVSRNLVESLSKYYHTELNPSAGIPGSYPSHHRLGAAKDLGCKLHFFHELKNGTLPAITERHANWELLSTKFRQIQKQNLGATSSVPFSRKRVVM